MNTSEIVAEVRSILDDKSSLVSGEPDELFSNERILRVLNHAQDILCREGWVLIDDTTASCCDLTLVADQETYALHASVLGVLSVRLSDSDLALGRRNWENLHPSPPPDPAFWDTNRALMFDAGRPQLYATDPATSKIAFWRKPDATAALLIAKLRVARIPITRLTLDDDTSPEVKAEWHLELARYAAGYLLSNTANNEIVNSSGDGPSAYTVGRAMVKDFMAAAKEARRDIKRLMVAAPRWQFGGWACDGG